MIKPKIEIFRYKRHIDIYVSNITFSTKVLISILETFIDSDIIVMIESDVNYIQALSLIGKKIGISEVMPRFRESRFSAACNKKQLFYLLDQVNVHDFEGMFVASVTNDIISNEFIRSLDHTANAMVKDGISDVSFSINFPENQMVISFSKSEHEVMYIKDKIYSIWG